jgi:NAD(P)-dependent dehydrogenase (short-subunit alcohol dehydrogenase family)
MGKAFFLGWVFLFNFNRPHKRGLIFSRLAGETAIATGGTVGICRDCATRRVEEGAEVAIFNVLDADGGALAAALTMAGHAAIFRKVDVGRVKFAIDVAATGFGRFDLLVKNAGISDRSIPTNQVVEAERGRIQVVNAKSMFFDTKHAITNLLSVAGLIGIDSVVPDHPSKDAAR